MKMSIATTRISRADEARPSYRWVILLGAWAAYLVSTMCRLAWGTMAVSVGGTIGLSLASLGAFIAAFYAGYVISNIGGGVATDRIGPRVMLAVSLFGLAAATFAFSFTPSLAVGLVLQGLMGMTAGGDYAAAIKLIATWFETRERGMAIGLFMTATSIAVVLANAILPSAVEHLGWRSTYRGLGLATFVLAVACSLVIRQRPQAQSRVSATPTSRQALGVLLRDRNFVLLSVAGFGGLWGTVGFASWASALMVRGHHISLVDAGFITAIFGIGAIVCKPLIGLLSDWIGGARRPLTIASFVMFFTMLLTFGQLNTLTAFQIAAPILGIGAYIYSPLLITLIAELGGLAAAGSTAGIANAAWQFGGVLAPLTVGVVFQATHSFEAAFLALAAGPMLGIVCMLFVVERRSGSTQG
jgi:sugar phosphate permease